MKILGNLIAGVGDWFVSLSDRARLQLVVLALVLLGGGGVIKLVRSVQALSEPPAAATPEQLIEPMQQLFVNSGDRGRSFSEDHRRTKVKLDSLSKIYPDLKIPKP